VRGHGVHAEHVLYPQVLLAEGAAAHRRWRPDAGWCRTRPGCGQVPGPAARPPRGLGPSAPARGGRFAWKTWCPSCSVRV